MLRIDAAHIEVNVFNLVSADVAQVFECCPNPKEKTIPREFAPARLRRRFIAQ